MDKPDASQISLPAPIRHDAYRGYILLSMLVFCILFYYLGEIIDLAGWEALRWGFLYGVHDVHRLLFMVPIIYAGYVFGVRATMMITIIALMTFLPRALFVSPFPDPLSRMVIFTVIAGGLGYLTATAHQEWRRCCQLEARLIAEKEAMLTILEAMTDGVVVIGPDYKIRLANPSMVNHFGEGAGAYCYQYLHQGDEPCRTCKLPRVIKGTNEGWQYHFPDGRTYEVLASPYVDLDGTVCQLTTFRRIKPVKS